MRLNRSTCADDRSGGPGPRSRATAYAIIRVRCWRSGRLNAAEVPSEHREGSRERGKRRKLALIAVIRKLVAQADISLREGSLSQDAPAKTFRLL